MTESSTPTGSGTPGHDEATVSAAVAAALAAAAQASNLAELKEARVRLQGDRSALARLNRLG